MLREFDEVKAVPAVGRDSAPAFRGRRPAAPWVPVLGAVALAAQLERLCRDQRAQFALLCASVERIEGVSGAVCGRLEHDTREEVARRLRCRVRQTDLVLRESERDTWIVLPDSDEQGVLCVIDRLVRVINGPYRIGSELVQVRVRLGCAAHPAQGRTTGELQRRAAERACG